MKKALKSTEVQRSVSFLLSLWLRFVYLTARVRVIMPESAKPYMRGKQQAIFCFWHGRMILNPFKNPRGRAMRVLISHHRDGALIVAVLRWFGIGTVRGSTNKGGDIAIRELFQVIAKGYNISITPDGPKGPAYIAQPGAAYIAQKTGLPIVPISFAASRAKIFDSWDNFVLPKPFTKVVFVVGEPIAVQAQDDIAERSLQLQESINRVMQEADKAVV
jgi:lysophospholipid acyltransferase (LPLAT)-like uncharacterized protein